MPRFFLGDPEEEGWGPSEPGVNNGGLKWLRSVLASTPAVSIAAGPAVDEGTEAVFTVTLSAAAPAAGLTLGYSVSEDGDFVASSDEGAKTLAIDGGATSATLEVPTAGDDDDEADGAVTVTLTAGAGYTLGSASSAAVTVRDDDDAAALPAITIYHDPAGATGRYDTAVELLTAAGRSYTVRFVTGTGEVDRLAGVSGSVLPRFFLGDPEARGLGSLATWGEQRRPAVAAFAARGAGAVAGVFGARRPGGVGGGRLGARSVRLHHVRGDALGGVGRVGVGGLGDLGRHGGRGHGLHRGERCAHLRTGRDEQGGDGHPPGRRARRGHGDVHA